MFECHKLCIPYLGTACMSLKAELKCGVLNDSRPLMDIHTVTILFMLWKERKHFGEGFVNFSVDAQ